jgi:hypothetical protein
VKEQSARLTLKKASLQATAHQEQQQSYSSTGHFSRIARDCLKVNFSGRWIKLKLFLCLIN